MNHAILALLAMNCLDPPAGGDVECESDEEYNRRQQATRRTDALFASFDRPEPVVRRRKPSDKKKRRKRRAAKASRRKNR